MNKGILLSGITLILIGVEVLGLVYTKTGITASYLVLTTIILAAGISITIRGHSMKSEFRYSKIIFGVLLIIFVYLGADMFFHYPYRIIIQFGTIAIIIWILRKNKKKPDSLEILKQRYAKGEITKEEFDKIKEDLVD
ncbi:conserved membrane hypothetical protein [metagenome]